MIRILTTALCLACLLLLTLAPASAQEEYPPECIEDPSLCEDWTTIEEWYETEEAYPAGGEEYPEECIEDPDLCADWTTVEEWNTIMEEEVVEETTEETTQPNAEYVSTGVACSDDLDWSNFAEVRVIQMRAGFTYTATVVGIGDFDPVLAVLDQGGNGLCIDDEPQASDFTVTLPTTDEVPGSGRTAQITFSNTSGEEFADISLYVTSYSGGSGEFVLVVEGMAVTAEDNAGDPFAVQITSGMVTSGVNATAYMISAASDLDSFVELIDANYVTMQDTEGYWIMCDDAGGANCWGYSEALADGASYIYSNVYGEWYGGQRDAMMSLSMAEGYEGNYYTFLMRSFEHASGGNYVVAFHIGI